ncbi:DEKNAAC103350 [Brettanomyces naardenensis]|uniref:Coatomer subunit gamma n=1 Tax=Brettanomyces naardenensis TaxID=13370 RepID=A0A448YN70_BRENA|nr:DEKNAAC103350 [Brettanomyces naardenensis]
MSTSTYKRFEDPESGYLPDKMTVYQECLQAFNASPIRAKKCRLLLSRLLRLLYDGQTFPKTEATNLFFSVSKLFHNGDPSLRQLAYLAIKELCTISDDVLMITASIMKDIQGGEPVFKPNAVRTLARVLDGSTIHAAERAMRNCIVDSNQTVCSAALVSTYHLLPVAHDVVRRWANEAQEAISANKKLVRSPYAIHEAFGSSPRLPQSTFFHQYHALGLIYQLKKQDRMAMLKLIQQLTSRQPLQSPFAVLQLVRYVAALLQADTNLSQQFWPLFASWLNHKSEMVELEAAKVVLTGSFKFNPDQQLKAISSLQELLSVPRTVTRFAAVRLLSRVALADPEKVRACNSDLESLVNDPCRAISTYAITTLLKTGNAQSVDRLVKTIAGFMDDISDEFKVVVVEAVRTLALKFPEKHSTLLSFLGDALRDEGGFSFKNSVIEAIFDIIKFVPVAREASLELLCEFIEDCEYTELAVRVLHLLGEYGPKTPKPSLYVRHIYNRVVLENSIVRSSAVIALSKFALVNDRKLTASIRILLKRCLQDADDEVRDRAALSLRLLEAADDGPTAAAKARGLLEPESRFSLAALEQQLCRYVRSKDKSSFTTPFDITSVATHTEEEVLAAEYKAKTTVEEDQIVSSPTPETTKATKSLPEPADLAARADLLEQQYAQELSAVPEFEEYGPLLHSSEVVELTEVETEFVVSAVKHIFKEHLVVQYNVQNTLKDIQLENVTVVAQLDTDAYSEDLAIPAETLKPDSSVSIYVSFSRPHDLALATLANTLSYVTKDVEEATGEPAEDDEGFPDEYQIEDLSIVPGDFVSPCFTTSFTNVFDDLDNEEVSVYNLGSPETVKIQEVVTKLTQSMSMMALEGSDNVEGSASHTLKLFGKSVNGDRVAAVVKLVSSSKGVMMRIQVRSSDAELSQLLANQW